MKKFRKNNKGFSLVELIIVIAIMAALIAILAPQYLKYVERSRVSADQTQVDEIIRAVSITLADPENTQYPGTVVIGDPDANGKSTITVHEHATGTDVDKFTASLTAALGSLSVDFKSKDMLTNGDITLTINQTTYAVGIAGAPPAWGIDRS